MRVRVNGREVGQTPLERDEDVGPYEVEVIGEAYHRHLRAGALAEQAKEALHATLQERLGALSIGSDPPDAEIYVDGVKRAQRRHQGRAGRHPDGGGPGRGHPDAPGDPRR